MKSALNYNTNKYRMKSALNYNIILLIMQQQDFWTCE